MRPRFGRLCKSSLLLIIAGLMPLTSTALAKADTAMSPWLVSALPTLDKIADLSAVEVTPMLKSINRDCQIRDILIKPERPLPLPPYIQSKQTIAGCVTDTAYGGLSNGNYLQRQGSTVYGTVVNNAGGSTNLIPIPYSSTGLVMDGGTYSGNYLWFIKNLDTTLNSSAIYTGEVTHKLPAPHTSGLHDISGRMLATQADTIGFSANGTWMVVDLPGIGTARVNTETYDVLPFGDAVNYNIGLDVGMRTTISPDGRYAAVASKSFDIFKLYDLSTCGPVPSLITSKVACTSRDLLPFIKSKVPGFSSIFRMRLRSDYTLDMFINNSQSNVLVTSHYMMLAAGQSATNFDYLALGDSFAAGEGAYQYKSITDTSINKCHLSQRSYPYLISNALNYGQYESVACSGAKIEDIISDSDRYKGQVKDGLTRKDRNLDMTLTGLVPGYIGQIEFSDHYQPNIITLSAAGNDIGFGDKIKRCLDTDTCYATYEDRLEIVNEINAQFYRLTDMYNQIKAGTDPRAKLYVIGYPQIAQPNGNCALNVHLNDDEIIFSQQLISYLNSVVKTAAANAGVFYVDTEGAFVGHKLCETDSWNVAVNGLTAGNDIADIPFVHGPIGNESFHPNAYGQELLKTTILGRTSNFTAAMPTPDPTALIKDPLASLPILQAPKTNRTTKLIRNISGTNNSVMGAGEGWIENYSPVSPFIKPVSNVQVWLNSEPTNLGTFTVDTSGNLTISTTIPNSVEPGFHTLHIYGKNTGDEDVDLYQTVYVAAKTNKTTCPLPLSGVDSDKDAVDDACDGMIEQPPTIITPDPVTILPPEPPAVTPPDPPAEPTPPEPPVVLPPASDPILTPPVTENPPSTPPPPSNSSTDQPPSEPTASSTEPVSSTSTGPTTSDNSATPTPTLNNQTPPSSPPPQTASTNVVTLASTTLPTTIPDNPLGASNPLTNFQTTTSQVAAAVTTTSTPLPAINTPAKITLPKPKKPFSLIFMLLPLSAILIILALFKKLLPKQN